MNNKNRTVTNFKNLRKKINKEKENFFQSFSNKKWSESLQNLMNENNKDNYLNFENNSLNENDIQEIYVNFRNIQKGVYNMPEIYKKNHNKYLSEKINSLSFRNKVTNYDSYESMNFPYIFQTIPNISDSLKILSNNTYNGLSKNKYESQCVNVNNTNLFYNLKNEKKENNLMDGTYSKPESYINIFNNKSFSRKYINYNNYCKNNYFYNRTNIDEEYKLNNMEIYNQEKDNNHKSSLTTIPKPQKFKKKIPPLPIKKSTEFFNNSFYFDDTNNKNNNINGYNQNNRYYGTKTVNNTYLYKNKRKIFIKKNIADYKKKYYTNRTYSPRYLKNIEKIGIKLSFSIKKKNDSIDLITPELFNDLRSYSSEKVKKNVIYSDLDIKIINDMDKNIFNQKIENHNKIRQKYIKRLSSYLIKNKKKNLKQSISTRKVKFDVIDIKKKIKKEKRKSSITNTNKFKKDYIDKDSPFATKIKKEDDKGGKIDFKIPDINLRKKINHNKLKDTNKILYLYHDEINQNRIKGGININKKIIHLNSARTIQKWWRNILTTFFRELNAIKIQSIYRGFIFRKKLKNNLKIINENTINDNYKEKQNITKILLIQKKWRQLYSNLKNKKILNISSSIKDEEKLIHKKIIKYQNNNNFYGIRSAFLQKNNNFGLILDKGERNTCFYKNGKNYFNQSINTNKSNNDSTLKYKNNNLKLIKVDEYNYKENANFNNYSNFNNNVDKFDSNNISVKPILIKDKNNVKICYYSKKSLKKAKNKEIIYIQNKFRKHIKNNNLKLKNDNNDIKKLPMLLSSFITKIRLIRHKLIINKKTNEKFNENLNQIINKDISINPSKIKYNNDIDFSFNNENNVIKSIPYIKNCYITKNNIFLLRKKPIDFSKNKIIFNNCIKKNTKYKEIKKNCKSKEDIIFQKKFQISKSINNYIISSYSKEQNKYKYTDNSKHLISYFSNKINGNPKNDPIYKISSINLNIISSNNNAKKYKLEIDPQNKALNYISITKIPLKKYCCLTKNFFIINKNKYNDKYNATYNDKNDDKYNEKINKDSNSVLNTHYIRIKNKEEENKINIKIRIINNNCFMSKIRKKENGKEINILQKFIKNKLEKRENKYEKIYMKIIMLNNLITKTYKYNRLNKNKIKVIQKLFKKHKNNQKGITIKNKSGKFLNNLLSIQNIKNIINRRNYYSFQNDGKNYGQALVDINTNYDTNENILKNTSTFKHVQKNENGHNKDDEIFIDDKIIINSYQKKDSFYDFDGNKNKDNENKYENIKKNEDEYDFSFYNDRIRKAYQINICKNNEEKGDKLENFVKLLEKYYSKYLLIKLIQNNNVSKCEFLLKMIVQRINKNINQFVYNEIKYNCIKENDDCEDNENISLTNSSNSLYNELIKGSFFFNTLKRHLKINKIDNNFEENNQINNLLKNNIPEYFKNKNKKCYIPYIGKNEEENLINTQLYLDNNDKLADYINKCYQKEKNILITPDIIENRLNKEPLKNKNLFAITRYMDNLFKDKKFGNIRCEKNNSNKNNSNYVYKIIKDDNLNDDNKKNISNSRNNKILINSFKNRKNNKYYLKNKILKRFNESNKESKSNDYNIILNDSDSNDINLYINRNNTNYNTVQKYDNNIESIRNSNQSDFIKKSSNKINNFIRNFTLRKKLRKNVNNYKSNNEEEKEELEIISYNYNYNNNLNEKRIQEIDLENEPYNIYDDYKDSNDEEKEEIKTINKSLFKKKISPIIPFQNKTNVIIKKVNTFRYEQDQYRKKYREIIKLRDTDMNYDNEIYENI